KSRQQYRHLLAKEGFRGAHRNFGKLLLENAVVDVSSREISGDIARIHYQLFLRSIEVLRNRKQGSVHAGCRRPAECFNRISRNLASPYTNAAGINLSREDSIDDQPHAALRYIVLTR